MHGSVTQAPIELHGLYILRIPLFCSHIDFQYIVQSYLRNIAKKNEEIKWLGLWELFITFFNTCLRTCMGMYR